MTLATMPKPVIAAVNGMAAGAGAGLAFACDFRLASSRAGFLIAFANVGLTLDSGVSWTLPRLVGAARATRAVPARRAVHCRVSPRDGAGQRASSSRTT